MLISSPAPGKGRFFNQLLVDHCIFLAISKGKESFRVLRRIHKDDPSFHEAPFWSIIPWGPFCFCLHHRSYSVSCRNQANSCVCHLCCSIIDMVCILCCHGHCSGVEDVAASHLSLRKDNLYTLVYFLFVFSLLVVFVVVVLASGSKHVQ